MKNQKVIMGMRIILGLILLIFGLNKFLNFMPMPPLPEGAGNFMKALIDTGYMMPLIALVEIVSGILLLINKYVPVALLILAPLSVNIVAFHAMLAPSGIAPAALVAILNILLLLSNKDKFSSVLAG